MIWCLRVISSSWLRVPHFERSLFLDARNDLLRLTLLTAKGGQEISASFLSKEPDEHRKTI